MSEATPLEKAQARREDAEASRDEARRRLAEAEVELTAALYAEIAEMAKPRARSHRKKEVTK